MAFMDRFTGRGMYHLAVTCMQTCNVLRVVLIQTFKMCFKNQKPLAPAKIYICTYMYFADSCT